MAETVDVPEKPPLSWLYDDPDGYVYGSTLTVDYDGSLWGEPGRACGVVQPPPGRRYVGGGDAHGHQIPERYPDETFSDFMVGPMQFIDDRGDVVQRQVGSIAVEGGHSNQAPDFPVLAESGSMRDRIKGAVDWLQRKGKYAHLTQDLAVYGRLSRVQSGPARGAIMFHGSAYPWLTHHAAMAINATTHSSEQWSHPDHGGRKQLIGVARVHASSYRNDVPAVLADFGTDSASDIVMWLDSLNPGDPVPEEQPNNSASERDESTPEAVMAEVDQPEFDAQVARVERLEERFDNLEAMLSSFIISQTSGDDLTIDNRVDTLHERLPLIEQTLVDLREQLASLTGKPPEDEDTASPLLTS